MGSSGGAASRAGVSVGARRMRACRRRRRPAVVRGAAGPSGRPDALPPAQARRGAVAGRTAVRNRGSGGRPPRCRWRGSPSTSRSPTSTVPSTTPSRNTSTPPRASGCGCGCGSPGGWSTGSCSNAWRRPSTRGGSRGWRRWSPPSRRLPPEIAALCRAVADRYGGVLADVLRLALPPRHARVEAERTRAASARAGRGCAPAVEVRAARRSRPAGGDVPPRRAAGYRAPPTRPRPRERRSRGCGCSRGRFRRAGPSGGGRRRRLGPWGRRG